MLKLCDTCNGRGLHYDGYWSYEGLCPTCAGSGFSNATAAEALAVELAERRQTVAGGEGAAA